MDIWEWSDAANRPDGIGAMDVVSLWQPLRTCWVFWCRVSCWQPFFWNWNDGFWSGGICHFETPTRFREQFFKNLKDKVAPKVPKGVCSPVVIVSCPHPRLSAACCGRSNSGGGKEEENRNQTAKRWPIYCQGPAGSMSRVLISTQTSGLTRLVIFYYQPANREGR